MAFVKIILVLTSCLTLQTAKAEFNISTDLYAVQTNMMQYKGYQNDLSATLYFKYEDYKLIPFLRHVLTNYYYLDERVRGTNGTIDYTSDRRRATGGGIDYQFNSYLRLRLITESIDNKLYRSHYTQESYGLIYNQYLNPGYIEFSNYLETFLIPRVSSNKLDTFLRIQAFKSFYFKSGLAFSNAIYPFVQVKAKFNDDANFGISGQNLSVGGGYKFYGTNNSTPNSVGIKNATLKNGSVKSSEDCFAFMIEAHSLVYQSKDFNADWSQIMAVLQIWID